MQTRLVLVGASLAEQSGHPQVPILRHLNQDRGTMQTRLVLVGASLAEQSRHLQVPDARRPNQDLGTILRCVVLVGASLAEQSGHLQVPAFRRRHQGRGTVLGLAAIWPKLQPQQARHLRGFPLASCTKQTSESIGIVISVPQPDGLKSKAWGVGGQDLVVLLLMPCWRNKKALAEDA